MSFNRKLERNQIKRNFNTNKIQKTWKLHQEQKYSILGYSIIQNNNKKRRK